MAYWKQLLGILIVVGLAVALADRYMPAARSFLTGQGPAADAAGAAEAERRGPPPGANGGRGGPGAGPRPSFVVLDEAGEITINDRVTALGTGAAVQSATLTPSTSGLLTEVRVKSGAEVAAREVIATLDQSSQQVAYDTARIALEDAQRTLERNRQLSGSSSVVSAAQMQSYQLAADRAELDLRKATIDLADRQIVSPIAGTIGIVRLNPGIEITPSTVIATVEDNSVIKLRFSLPERYVGKVAPGDQVLATPIAQPGNQRHAVVMAVDNQVDETTGSFEIEARIANDDGRLRSGMTFRVTMQFAGDTYRSVSPLAVQWGTQGAYVWRATDQVVRRVPVEVVQRNAEGVLVAGPLAPGDRIVTEGIEGLREGMTVQIVSEPPESRGATPPAGAGTAARGEGGTGTTPARRARTETEG